MPSLSEIQPPYEKSSAKSRRLSLKIWQKYAVFAIILFLFCYPEYLKRLFYPYIFGEPTNAVLDTSSPEIYQDMKLPAVTVFRHKTNYILLPKTKYAVTAKVAYVDYYDTVFNRIYRGHSQKDYINLVPLDLFLLNGDMAKPEIMKLFTFEHEERLGRVLCKGVKYSRSFWPTFFKDEEEYEASKAKLQQCEKYQKEENLNNYHPIPANEKINKALHQLVFGDTVYLEGFLVDVPQMGLKTGTRKQQHHQYVMGGQQPGMCFILYTTKVIVNNRVYQ